MTYILITGSQSNNEAIYTERICYQLHQHQLAFSQQCLSGIQNALVTDGPSFGSKRRVKLKIDHYKSMDVAFRISIDIMFARS